LSGFTAVFQREESSDSGRSLTRESPFLGGKGEELLWRRRWIDMTGREKIEAAFSEGGTGKFPVVIPYEGIFIRDHWDELTSCPWWYAFDIDMEHQLRWRREAIDRIGQDWFELPSFPARTEREYLSIEERSGEVFRVHSSSGRREKLTRPQVSGLPSPGELVSVHPTRLPATIEEIDLLLPVPPGFDEGWFRASGCGDLAAALLKEFGVDLFPVREIPSPLWCCYGLWGFEGMMTMTLDQPQLVRHACERFFGHAVYAIEEAAALGAAGIWIEECMTDMIGPDAFESLNLPFVRGCVDAIRQMGLRSIYYFCGNPAGKWDLILSTGADAVAFEEGKKGFRVDIEDVLDRVNGRCAVLGNFDAIGILEHGSDQDLRREVSRHLDAGKKAGGRFIMSLGSPVTPGTTVDRVRRYTDLVHELSGS
jgi:hypothetical protein